MFILHGTYRFGLKKIGVRRDICNNCKRECIAEEWQSFHCHHFFFIPLIPLGTRKEWHCTLCNADPRYKSSANGLLKILGGLVCFCTLMGTIALWGSTPDDLDAGPLWLMRFIFPAVFGVVLWATFIRQPQPTLTPQQRRSMLTPLDDKECFYCHGPLDLNPTLHCPRCQVTIYRD